MSDATFHPADTPALRLGQRAPNFRARSTRGPIELSDFHGMWVILFSHPADFTPVCTSEFVALAKAQSEFTSRGCHLLALSVDSLYSHLAWIRMIHDRFGVRIEFPILEDPTLEIAKAFGMIGADSADAASVRATFFLDPNGVLRASTCYPAEVGRSIDEMVRILAALQKTDMAPLLTPAGWREGDDLLRAPVHAIEDVLAAETASDWFYSTVPDTGGAA
ncbi:MAG: peroxiredoxin [Sphingomonadales bacterium]|nr:peroxiredoxin [Sphingomonadales bacterium]MDE2567322.1 peroxiredoxin [Sphingomonadales bacterium]